MQFLVQSLVCSTSVNTVSPYSSTVDNLATIFAHQSFALNGTIPVLSSYLKFHDIQLINQSHS